MSDTLTYAGAELEATASEINNLSEQIADLNGAIVSAGRNTTSQADLWDQRDRHVSRLAQLTGATSRVREDGQAAVFVGGRVLVDNKTVLKVQATATELQWAIDGAKVDASGYVGSLHTLVSTTIPALRASLDAVAASLVSQTNAIHTAAADPSGATGRLFYDPAGVTAATIAISTDPTNGVSGNPQRVAAASVAGAVFDGSAAHALALLGDAPTGPDAAYMGFLSSLGVATSSARSRAASSELVLAAAANDYNATAQVNLDDELAEMTAAQRAYQASARVVTAIDEMLDDLIRRFGRVGA
jgi:flagellar hook-associated protein 1 FlgK